MPALEPPLRTARTAARTAAARRAGRGVRAGSGIGRALALNLAQKGAKLALSDIDAEGLAETVRQAERLGAEVKADCLNVAEREAVLGANTALPKLRQPPRPPSSTGCRRIRRWCRRCAG